MKCEHLNFKAEVNVTRLTEPTDPDRVTGYTTDISVHCADCMMPFRWVGVPFGMSSSKPMTDPERVELRAPIEPIKL